MKELTDDLDNPTDKKSWPDNFGHAWSDNSCQNWSTKELIFLASCLPCRSYKDGMVRDGGKFLFVTLRMEHVTYVMASLLQIHLYCPLFKKIDFWFLQEPNWQLNGLFTLDVLKDEVVRDQGKLWFVTLRMCYVMYLTVFYTQKMSCLNLGNPLLQECYTSHVVVLHFQILQSGKPR